MTKRDGDDEIDGEEVDEIDASTWADQMRSIQPDEETPASRPQVQLRLRRRRARGTVLPVLAPMPGEEEIDVDAYRPRTRAECVNGIRPCPFVLCKHHLYLDVDPHGVITRNSDVELLEMEETCVLDLAERGGIPGSGNGAGLTLEEVATIFGVTRERIRQIEARGLHKLRRPNARREIAEFAEEGSVRKRATPPPVEEPADEPEDHDDKD